jgi:hypothetical protein
LAALFARSAVATRRSTTYGPDKHRAVFASLLWFSTQCPAKAAGDDKANQKTA